ncbi:MAG: AI-2E family transporter [Sphingomicrobium sp.]
MTNRAGGTAQILTGVAAGLALLYFLRDILIPFVIAFVLSVLVSALVRFIRKRWAGAPDWAVASLAALVVIICAAGGLFILVQGTVQIVAEGPKLADRLDQIVLEFGRSLHLREDLHLSGIIGNVSIPEIAGSILSGLQGFAAGLLLMIVYFGFMLAGRQRISRKIDVAAGSSERASAIKSVAGRAATDIETYVWVQTITGLILTTSAVVVMMAVGLNNVLFWTVLFFLLTFIPNIGITIGSILPSLFALIQFPTYWEAIVIFAVTQVTATIVGNLIYPRMQAQTQNIDPVVTLLALAFWTVLWGIPGAFLAVPLTLMSMMVFSQFDDTRWVAALLSNDGNPVFRRPGKGGPD